METFDVVVLGAGAAGLMAAAVAARRGRRVVVLDHARQAGEKILISGGGRCNFTNRHTDPEKFWSDNKRFCRSALSRYTPVDFLEIVERHGIAWHEKTLGQLFCDGSARQIVDMLLGECAAAGATVRVQQRVGDVSRADRFRVETEAGAIEAESVVIATGGLSIPKIGASGFGLELARRFGLGVTATRPGLVPLVLGGEEMERLAGLAGVSAAVGARCGGARFEEGMVVTHRGLSGPAVLQVSSVWREGETVEIDLLPGHETGVLCARKRARPRAGMRGTVGDLVPQRLADAFVTGAPRAMGDVPDRELTALEEALRRWRVRPSGTEGYAKAEVMLGGVATAGLSQRTMAAREVPGLFVVGEAVDVTGWLGGYNFQWAWASGFVAGEAA